MLNVQYLAVDRTLLLPPLHRVIATLQKHRAKITKRETETEMTAEVAAGTGIRNLKREARNDSY